MKHLLLLRHSEAEYNLSLEDQERPLSAQGQGNARKICELLKETSWTPSMILCSSAVRTRQTAKPFLASIPGLSVDYRDSLYLAGAGQIYEAVKNASDDFAALMVVGHNPGIHAFARFLVGEADAAAREKIQTGYQTGWLSVFSCPCDHWEDLMPGSNRLETVLDPHQP